MKNEKNKFYDDVDEVKKYFTQVPNFVIDDEDIPLHDMVVYICIRRVASESGSCWYSVNNLARKCKMSRNRMKKSIKSLIHNDLIELHERGAKNTNKYRMSKIWAKNTSFYEKDDNENLSLTLVKYKEYENKGGPERASKGSREGFLKGHEATPNKINNNKTKIKNSCASARKEDNKPLGSFGNNFKTPTKKQTPAKEKKEWTMPDIIQDKQIHVRRIGMYKSFANIKIENKKQYDSFIKRNVTASTLLSGYEDPRIIEVMEYLKETANYKWDLGTVGKFIDHDISKLKNMNQANNPNAGILDQVLKNK